MTSLSSSSSSSSSLSENIKQHVYSNPHFDFNSLTLPSSYRAYTLQVRKRFTRTPLLQTLYISVTVQRCLLSYTPQNHFG